MFNIPNIDIILNLLMAAFLGGVIGTEREIHGRDAGLRTHLLVSLGSALFVSMAPALNDNVGRIAAQIISGIGFIGAGSIMKSDKHIKGVTTAACLWVCASIGIACGLGLYSLASFVSIISVISLVILTYIEKLIHKNEKK